MSDTAGPLGTLLAFLAGCGAGRFVNVAAVRFGPRERLRDQLRSLVRPTPHERVLTAGRGFSRVPVVGWLLPSHPLGRGGRGERWRFAVVELAAGLLVAGLFWVEVANWHTWGPPGRPPYLPDVARQLECVWDGSFTFALHAALVLSLLTATVIDLRRMLIPDGTTLPAMALALLAGLTGRAWLVPVWFEDGSLSRGVLVGAGTGPQVPGWVTDHPHLHGLAVSVVGAAVGFFGVWAVRVVAGRILAREALGFGDVILMACVGAFLGWQPTIVAFFAGAVLACAVVLPVKLLATLLGRGGGPEFPFGPWLAGGAAVVLLMWPRLWPEVGQYFALGPVMLLGAVGLAALFALLLWAIQIVKRLVGLDSPAYLPGEAWGSADTLGYLAAETPALNRPDAAPGAPRAAGPHRSAGRGRSHADAWRHPRKLAPPPSSRPSPQGSRRP